MELGDVAWQATNGVNGCAMVIPSPKNYVAIKDNKVEGYYKNHLEGIMSMIKDKGYEP
jgi:hypothetical protein